MDIQNNANGKQCDMLADHSHDNFIKLTESVPGVIFQFTRRTDGTYFVPLSSSGIKNIFGCLPEDVLDDFSPIEKVLFPEDAKMVIDTIEFSAKNMSIFTCEFRVMITGKSIQWICTNSKPEKLIDGSVTWYGYSYDVTERKIAENLLYKKIMELENLNKLMVDRELKMAALKLELQEFKNGQFEGGK